MDGATIHQSLGTTVVCFKQSAPQTCSVSEMRSLSRSGPPTRGFFPSFRYNRLDCVVY